jgi:TRAP-type C4-dicarboxylate transport system substrate-binding protein
MRVTALLVGLGLALAGSEAVAQTKWDMPTPYPDGNYHTQNVRWFADEVKKATNGQLEIIVQSNGSLIKHPDILRAVQTGQVNIGEMLLSQFGNEDAIFEIEGIPFFATGYDNAWRLYQAQKPLLEDRFGKRAIRLLYSVAWPGQGLYSKTAMASLADYKGVKMRTYNPATSRLAELMGAVPTTVQSPEVPQAFATNIVTAMITSPVTGVDTKAWEFSKFFYDTKAMHPRNVVIVNQRSFRSLPEPVQKSVLDIAAQAEKRGWDLAKQAEETSIKKLAEGGMTVAKPEPAMMAEFQKIGDTMIGDWQKKAGADGEKLVQAFRGK